MKQLALDIVPLPQPTLSNFVLGRNGELVATLYALANGSGDERFLYLWGAAGSGRSHLLRAVADVARRNGRSLASLNPGAAGLDVDRDAFAVVDDVHRLDAEAQIALFNMHNCMQSGSGVLIVSGDAAPAQLTLRPDLVTRLAAGLVYQVHVLDDEEKTAALRRHADTRGFQLSQEVAAYLLRHARRDMPSLLALLEALDRYSLESKRAITVPLLRELLEAGSETS